MISYEIYKIIHLTSLFILFSSFAVQFYQPTSKSMKIVSGLVTVLVLVSGMGLMARIGINHGEGWPLWIYLKIGLWFVVGMLGPIVGRRFSHVAPKLYPLLIFLGFLGVTIANYKP